MGVRLVGRLIWECGTGNEINFVLYVPFGRQAMREFINGYTCSKAFKRGVSKGWQESLAFPVLGQVNSIPCKHQTHGVENGVE